MPTRPRPHTRPTHHYIYPACGERMTISHVHSTGLGVLQTHEHPMSFRPICTHCDAIDTKALSHVTVLQGHAVETSGARGFAHRERGMLVFRYAPCDNEHRLFFHTRASPTACKACSARRYHDGAAARLWTNLNTLSAPQFSAAIRSP